VNPFASYVWDAQKKQSGKKKDFLFYVAIALQRALDIFKHDFLCAKTSIRIVIIKNLIRER